MRNGYGDFGLTGIFMFLLFIIMILGLIAIPSNYKVKYNVYEVNGTIYGCQEGFQFNRIDKTCFIKARIKK